MILDWNVVFPPRRGFWRHVWAFGYDAVGQVWTVVDPHAHGIDVYSLTPDAFDAFALNKLADAEVWRRRLEGRAPVIFPGLWCVGVVKRLVGLRSCALSVAGLRRDLIASGAIRVFQR